MLKSGYKLFLLLIIGILIYGWGSTGHKIINRKAVFSFPGAMSSFYWWRDSLANHASDADYRKGSDPSESKRHYIDIDNYPEFVANGRIPQTLDSLIAIYGVTVVNNNGILPYTIIATVDSVKKYFQQNNWQKAMLKAADLGHYVADAHNPLHITRNYDGQYSNQTGIHSRYETQMINADTGRLAYTYDSAFYVPNVNQFVFNFVYHNYQYVDSLLKADSIAYALAGNYGSLYLQQLWNRSGYFTVKMFKNSSNYLATLIYTAWINAGSPLPTSIASNETEVTGYSLKQNYPNPFNPSTTISFNLPVSSYVSLKVYDAAGKLSATLLEERKGSGSYSVTFNASILPSGVYFYKLNTDKFSAVKKMILAK